MENKALYYQLEKVDAHIHYNTNRAAMLELAKEENFRFVTINTDIYFFPSIDEQEQIVFDQRKAFGNRLDFIGTFPADGFTEADWLANTIAKIQSIVDKGAVSIKIWKNIGMELRGAAGELAMIDDARIAPIFKYMADNGINFTGHQGEPKNCWLPIEKMTIKQDTDYFTLHPEYHMFLHPDFPSYEAQIAARDNVLTNNPTLKFCGCHFASLEWSVEEIGKRLDKYPNMMVDTAERISHLQHRAVTDPDVVRDFVMKYQDRIIYGTDIIDDNSLSDEALKTHLKAIWDRHWKYFTTSDMMTSPKVSQPFKGLGLPMEVVEKIYTHNAVKFYKLQKLS